MTDDEFSARLLSSLDGKILRVKSGGDCLLPFGGASGSVWLLEEGHVLSYRNMENGDRIGTGIYAPNSLLGIKSFNGETDFVFCRALDKVLFRGFNTKAMTELMYREPDLMHHVLQLSCRRFKFALDAIEAHAIKSVEEQIDFFEDKLRELPGGQDLQVSDSIIADFLGVHPSSISRARKHRQQTKRAVR